MSAIYEESSGSPLPCFSVFRRGEARVGGIFVSNRYRPQESRGQVEARSFALSLCFLIANIAILEFDWGVSSDISDKSSRKHGFIIPTLCARRANSSNANRRPPCVWIDVVLSCKLSNIHSFCIILQKEYFTVSS
jgi:hypothetical protein